MTPQGDDQPSKYGNVGKSWQRTFEALEDLGASDKPSVFSISLSRKFNSLSHADKAQIAKTTDFEPSSFKSFWNHPSWNFKAFFFGPIYYFCKGMWRKGFLLLSAAFLLASFTLLVPNLSFIGLIISPLCATLANRDYYLHKTQNVKTWKYLPDFLTHPASVTMIFLASVLLLFAHDQNPPPQ